MAGARYDNVEGYLASLDEVKHSTVGSILDFIATEFPGATVKLAWNVPQVQMAGAYVFGVAAAKNHLTLSPWSTEVLSR